MKPIDNLEEALQLIDAFTCPPEAFRLPLSIELHDPIGMNLAIITDRILAKGWEPDGFEQEDNYWIYRYKYLE